MSEQTVLAIVAGAFALGGIVIGAVLNQLNSYIEHRRQQSKETSQANDNEYAIFHGAFAVTNYVARVLDDWDSDSRIHVLGRLSVAQPYLATLIDRSPRSSDRLMVSLIDLGLSLEGLLFVSGISIGLNPNEEPDRVEVNKAVEDLSRAIELVQLVLGDALNMVEIEDFIEPEELERLKSEAQQHDSEKEAKQ